MTKRSVVLLSSGLDSTVNFYQALKESEVLMALTFDYGQKAAEREIHQAKKISQKFNVSHQVVRLPFFSELGESSLTSDKQSVPSGREVSIDDQVVSEVTAKAVWVPNRNGIFLNVAAGFAESLKADWIVPGFNKEEAKTFPDNSDKFLQATSKALSFSTSNKIEVQCFTTHMNKTEIVVLGQSLAVDWSLIWPCYFSNQKWCGQCESCQRSIRALEASGVSYAEFVI